MATLHENALKFNAKITIANTGANLSTDAWGNVLLFSAMAGLEVLAFKKYKKLKLAADSTN